jgi:PKHD-type hydroxylase
MRPIYKYYRQVLTKEDCDYLIKNGLNNLEVSKVSREIIPSKLLRKGKVSWIKPGEDKKSDEIVQKIVNLMFWEAEETHGVSLSKVENVQFAKYGILDHYNKHMDVGSDGTYRVLSAVVELSDPKDYIGGGLNLYLAEKTHPIPFEQGTVVTFPSILPHKAKPVFWGNRYSLTLWGSRD